MAVLPSIPLSPELTVGGSATRLTSPVLIPLPLTESVTKPTSSLTVRVLSSATTASPCPVTRISSTTPNRPNSLPTGLICWSMPPNLCTCPNISGDISSRTRSFLAPPRSCPNLFLKSVDPQLPSSKPQPHQFHHTHESINSSSPQSETNQRQGDF